jgi:hypothetical protein
MLILLVSGTSEGRERAIGTEEHQFAANNAATRKLPTHPKYFNNGTWSQSQRRSADCSSRRQASLKSRNGSISLIKSGRSTNVLFGDR